MREPIPMLKAYFFSLLWGCILWGVNGLLMVALILSPQPGVILPQTWENAGLAVPYYILAGLADGALFAVLLKYRSAAETGCITIIAGMILGLVLGEMFGAAFGVVSKMPMDFLVWRLLSAFLGLVATSLMFQFTIRFSVSK